jgi:hypothetical protein
MADGSFQGMRQLGLVASCPPLLCADSLLKKGRLLAIC